MYIQGLAASILLIPNSIFGASDMIGMGHRRKIYYFAVVPSQAHIAL